MESRIDVIDEKIENINDKINTNTNRINCHGERIDNLEKSDARLYTRIDHLCEKIDSLAAAIRRTGFGLIGVLVAFFIWYIQQL